MKEKRKTHLLIITFFAFILSSQALCFEINYQVVPHYSETDDDFLIDLPLKHDIVEKFDLLVNIEIGTPPQNFKVLIDSGSKKLWINGTNCRSCSTSQNTFDKSKSSSFDKRKTLYHDKITYGHGFASGAIVADKVGFKGSNPVFLDFLLADDSSKESYDGVIGLSNITNEEESCILTQLKKQNIISEHVFSQHMDYAGNGILAIGEYPNELQAKIKSSSGNNDFIKSCDLVKGDKHWSCYSNGVFFEDAAKPNTVKLSREVFIFDTGSTTNYLKSSIFHKVVQGLFQDLISKGICSVKPIDQSHTALVCSSSLDLSSLKPLHFQFGNGTMHIDPKDYFTKEKMGYVFELMLLKGQEFNIIGMPLLKRYYCIFNKTKEVFQWAENPVFIKEGKHAQYSSLPDGSESFSRPKEDKIKPIVDEKPYISKPEINPRDYHKYDFDFDDYLRQRRNPYLNEERSKKYYESLYDKYGLSSKYDFTKDFYTKPKYDIYTKTIDQAVNPYKSISSTSTTTRYNDDKYDENHHLSEMYLLKLELKALDSVNKTKIQRMISLYKESKTLWNSSKLHGKLIEQKKDEENMKTIEQLIDSYL